MMPSHVGRILTVIGPYNWSSYGTAHPFHTAKQSRLQSNYAANSSLGSLAAKDFSVFWLHENIEKLLASI